MNNKTIEQRIAAAAGSIGAAVRTRRIWERRAVRAALAGDRRALILCEQGIRRQRAIESAHRVILARLRRERAAASAPAELPTWGGPAPVVLPTWRRGAVVRHPAAWALELGLVALAVLALLLAAPGAALLAVL